MLLFFSSACLLAFQFIVNPRIRRSASLLTSGAGSIFVVIHLLVEGYRVQLLFLYGFTLLMLILSMIDAFKTPAVVQTASRIRRGWDAFYRVWVNRNGCFLYVFPVFNFPEPTGELKVSTQVLHFIDSSREETFGTTETGKRELMVQVWYPAQAGSGKYAPFIPHTRILRYMAAYYGLPKFTFQHLKYVSSHAYTGPNSLQHRLHTR